MITANPATFLSTATMFPMYLYQVHFLVDVCIFSKSSI